MSCPTRRAWTPSTSNPTRLGLAALAVLLTFAASDASSNPEFVRQTLTAAMDQTGRPVRYDGAYRRIPYPGGDVPFPRSASAPTWS